MELWELKRSSLIINERDLIVGLSVPICRGV